MAGGTPARCKPSPGSTAQAFTGNNSMAVNFNFAVAHVCRHGVDNPPAAVKAGSAVSFEVYVPSAALSIVPGASLPILTDIKAFFMDANWAWTSTTVSASNLKANARNKVSVTVPTKCRAPFTEIGVQFDFCTSWTATIYVDSVTVQ